MSKIRVSIDTIKTVGKYFKKEPSEYHHRCSGNDDFRNCATAHLDQWTVAQTIDCWRIGRINHLTPRCEACDGRHTVEEMVLRDGQICYNQGIDDLIEYLSDNEEDLA